MKYLLIVLSVAIATNTQAQKAKIQKDTLYYSNLKVYKGSELQLSYGSNANDNFVFVYSGVGLSKGQPLSSRYARQVVKIDTVYTQNGKGYARGLMTDIMRPNVFGEMVKVFIDVEDAVDILEVQH
jgi:hypothetical protein